MLKEKKAYFSIFPEDNENAVIKAEMFFTSLVIKHNVPDHAGGLFQAMFLIFKIAKKYGCSGTETCYINTWVLTSLSLFIVLKICFMCLSLDAFG